MMRRMPWGNQQGLSKCCRMAQSLLGKESMWNLSFHFSFNNSNCFANGFAIRFWTCHMGNGSRPLIGEAVRNLTLSPDNMVPGYTAIKLRLRGKDMKRQRLLGLPPVSPNSLMLPCSMQPSCNVARTCLVFKRFCFQHAIHTFNSTANAWKCLHSHGFHPAVRPIFLKANRRFQCSSWR